MPHHWISAVLCTLLVSTLTSCATRKETLLPHGPTTMREVWDQHTSGSVRGGAPRALIEARETLRRPLTASEASSVLKENASYSRTSQTEIERQFKRLPNPDLLMYVFPHLSGDPRVPVPGYSTVFPLYERVEYALPGERTEDY
jgi:conjugative transfer region lipoprotein (TIGR03751 family)